MKTRGMWEGGREDCTRSICRRFRKGAPAPLRSFGFGMRSASTHSCVPTPPPTTCPGGGRNPESVLEKHSLSSSPGWPGLASARHGSCPAASIAPQQLPSSLLLHLRGNHGPEKGEGMAREGGRRGGGRGVRRAEHETSPSLFLFIVFHFGGHCGEGATRPRAKTHHHLGPRPVLAGV